MSDSFELWWTLDNPTQPAQQIFLIAECHFMQFTSKTELQRLDISCITHNATSDRDICNLIKSDAELELDGRVCKDVSHGIVRILFSDIRLRQSKPKQAHYAKN